MACVVLFNPDEWEAAARRAHAKRQLGFLGALMCLRSLAWPRKFFPHPSQLTRAMFACLLVVMLTPNCKGGRNELVVGILTVGCRNFFSTNG